MTQNMNQKRKVIMFDTHVLNPEGFKQMDTFKKAAANFVREAEKMMVVQSREKSIFTTKMEEAVFFGAKAIAQIEDNHQSKKEF